MSRSAKITKRPIMAAVMGLVVMGAGPAVSSPWDGVVTGTIFGVDITGGENFGFRIYLQPVAAACAGGPSWAYLRESDSNYKTYVAALLMAKSQGSVVTLYTTVDANNYCHIGYVAIRG